MDPIGYIKTNAILILLIICGVQFALGSVGVLYYKHELKVAEQDLRTTENNYAVCTSANQVWTKTNEERNAVIATNLEITKKSQEAAEAITAAAAAISGGQRSLAQKLNSFQPSKNATTDCDKAREAVDAFYATKKGATK